MPARRRETERERQVIAAAEEERAVAEVTQRLRHEDYRRMGISQRKQAAFGFFAKRYTNAEVAREMGIHPDTVTRYRREYDASLQQQAESNPHMLRDVLRNTLQVLEELDKVIKEAWSQYQAAASPTTKKDFLAQIIKALSERAKLFGLMGVKQDTLVYINGVKQVQDRLMDFMQSELCEKDRKKLERYLSETFKDQLSEVDTPADIEAAVKDARKGA